MKDIDGRAVGVVISSDKLGFLFDRPRGKGVMKNQRFDGWSRREFLGGLAMAGAAAALGLRPLQAASSVEPPPETTRLRIHRGKTGMLGAHVRGRAVVARRRVHRCAVCIWTSD
jgi:hypothetical protein